MKRLFLFLLSLTLSSPVLSQEPEEVLNKYFEILTSRDFAGISQLMDSNSMANLKTLMDDTIRYQANHGRYDLQRNVFGKRVSLKEVENTPAEFYLEKLANQILEAAESQHLVVENRKILGSVKEGDDIVHYVARLTMHQDDESANDIFVYTLVKEGGGWKLVFPPTIRQVLTVIEAQAKQPR